MSTKTTRGYGWGRRLIRRLILAATLALASALAWAATALAGPSPDKYIW